MIWEADLEWHWVRLVQCYASRSWFSAKGCRIMMFDFKFNTNIFYRNNVQIECIIRNVSFWKLIMIYNFFFINRFTIDFIILAYDVASTYLVK